MDNDTITSGPVRLLRNGVVSVLELNRPDAMNALDTALTDAFLDACRRVTGDAGVRAVVVRGAGRAFGVGGDLTEMRGDDAKTMPANAAAIAKRLIDGLHGGLRLLAAGNAPVLAALHGAVAGGSMSLALGCDLRIAADNARFNLAYARIGASNDGSSSWHLPRLVGLGRAMEIALLNDSIDAAEALRLGLVNRVVPVAELERESMALAQRLAEGPTKAYGRIKRLLRASFERDLSAQLDAEADAFVEGTTTEDFREGLEAFFGKRAARFSGR